MNYLTEIILVLLATLIGGELALRIQLPRVVIVQQELSWDPYF